MSWPWSSNEEFCERVIPCDAFEPDFGVVQRQTRFEQVQRMAIAAENISSGVSELKQMALAIDPRPDNRDRLDNARRLVLRIATAGEELLLLHRRLAKSRTADDFIAIKKLHEEWEQHLIGGTLTQEIQNFISASEALSDGFSEFVRDDSELLVTESILPDPLLRDFRLARDLFLVGFDEMGAFAAGRGLEGVLRSIAADREIEMRSKDGKLSLAHEARFHDLIEVFHRLRWSRDKSQVVDAPGKDLLNLLKGCRNNAAHPNQRPSEVDWLAVAKLASKTASTLWRDFQRPRVRLVSKVVQRDW